VAALDATIAASVRVLYARQRQGVERTGSSSRWRTSTASVGGASLKAEEFAQICAPRADFRSIEGMSWVQTLAVVFHVLLAASIIGLC